MSRGITIVASASVQSASTATVLSRILTVSAVGVRRLATAQCSIALGRGVSANPIAGPMHCDILMKRTVTANPKQIASAICRIFIGRIPVTPLIQMRMSVSANATKSWTAQCNIRIGLLTGTRIPIVTGMSLTANPRFKWAGTVPIVRSILVSAKGGILIKSPSSTVTRVLTLLATGRVSHTVTSGIATGIAVGASAVLVRRDSVGLGGGLFITANPTVQSASGETAVIVPHITVGAKANVVHSAQVTITRGLSVSATTKHTVLAICNILTRCQLGPRPPIPAGIMMWLYGLPNVRISASAGLTMGRGMTAAGRQRQTIAAAIVARMSMSATVVSTGLSATVVMGRAITASPTALHRASDPIGIRIALTAVARRLITPVLGIGIGASVQAIAGNAAAGASATILTRCQMVATGKIRFSIFDLIQCRFTVTATPQIYRNATVGIQGGIAVGATGRALMGAVSGIHTGGAVAVGAGSGIPGTIGIQTKLAMSGVPHVMIRPFLAVIGMGMGVGANLSVIRSGEAHIQTSTSMYCMGGKSNKAVTQIGMGMAVGASGVVQFLGGVKSGVRGAGPQGTVRGAGPQGGTVSGK